MTADDARTAADYLPSAKRRATALDEWSDVRVGDVWFSRDYREKDVRAVVVDITQDHVVIKRRRQSRVTKRNFHRLYRRAEQPVSIQGVLGDCDTCGIQIAAGSDQLLDFVLLASAHHDETSHHLKVRVVRA